MGARYQRPMIWRRRIEPFTRPLFFAFSRAVRGMTLGVRAVATDGEGRVLLVEHTYLHGWHLPGGGVDRGETGEQAVARELREEAGIEPTDRPVLLSAHSNERVFRGDHVLVYRIPAWREVGRPQGAEILNVGFFALDALPEGVTAATRRRLAEAFEGAPADPHW
jgi:ADP-ribose pyrophosphatase YjhB (NUDIX family)